jgi:hypothetical protein
MGRPNRAQRPGKHGRRCKRCSACGSCLENLASVELHGGESLHPDLALAAPTHDGAGAGEYFPCIWHRNLANSMPGGKLIVTDCRMNRR